jgi:hypothetical protein
MISTRTTAVHLGHQIVSLLETIRVVVKYMIRDEVDDAGDEEMNQGESHK